MKNQFSFPHRIALAVLAGITLAFAAHGAETKASFTSVDIGDIKPGSTTELAPGRDFEIRGFGRQFGLHATADSGRYVYTKLKGDFDLTVQVRAVENEDQSFGEVGLLVRQDLTPAGLEVGQFVSNNFYGEQDQYTFMFRMKEGGAIDPWAGNWIPDFWGKGTFGGPGFGYSAKGYAEKYARPRPFPYVWLRLIRTGNHFRGLTREYLDSWTVVGQQDLALGDEVYVGLAISANHHTRKKAGGDGDPTIATNASFRNLTITQ